MPASRKRPSAASENPPDDATPLDKIASKRPATLSRRQARPRNLPPPGLDWFSRVFQFAEADYEQTQTGFETIEKCDGTVSLKSKAGQKLVYGAGRFACPTLAQLRALGSKLKFRQGDRLVVTNELGDAAAKHASPENRHATFQVASQFNCLEFPGPSTTPEDGVTGYATDRTQGPACSIACGPATIYRNYFAMVHGAPAGERGQKHSRMIDNLASVSQLLGNDARQLYEVHGGYTMASNAQLRALNKRLQQLRSEGREDELRAALHVGVHQDVQVTAIDWGQTLVNDPQQTVTQVFGSACSVAYNRSQPRLWRPFASLVLEASYEATLWAAALAAQRHEGRAGSKKVFLTCLGGGVFGNEMEWICGAMRRAFKRFKNFPLDIRIVTYAGKIPAPLAALEAEFPLEA